MFGHGRRDRSGSRATPSHPGRIPTHEPQRRHRLSLLAARAAPPASSRPFPQLGPPRRSPSSGTSLYPVLQRIDSTNSTFPATHRFPTSPARFLGAGGGLVGAIFNLAVHQARHRSSPTATFRLARHNAAYTFPRFHKRHVVPAAPCGDGGTGARMLIEEGCMAPGGSRDVATSIFYPAALVRGATLLPRWSTLLATCLLTRCARHRGRSSSQTLGSC